MIFEPKKKKPVLSPEMEDIINKSMGEDISSAVDDISRYKYKIMDRLVSDKDIIESLNGSKDPNACRNKNIINYLKMPHLMDTVKSYICYDVRTYGKGDLSTVDLIFRVVVFKDEVDTDWGIARQDLIAAIIKNKFDWTNAFGLHLELALDEPKIGEDEYYYREIVYSGYSPYATFNKTVKR